MVEKFLPGIQADWFSRRSSFPLEAPKKLGNLIQSILIDLTEQHAEKSEKPLFEVA